MQTLVLANQKGGVGKSAVATLLAHYLHRQGRRVLAIDLDHQGSLSQPLRLSGRAGVAGSPASAWLTQPQVVIPAGDLVLVPADRDLLGLERQPQQHTPFLRNLRANLHAVQDRFDVCIIDTNPNPDIRVIAALVLTRFVLSPIQLNREAMSGVSALLNHERVGLRKIKTVLNPDLHLIGLLPNMVEATPFQKSNFLQLVQQYHPLLIRLGPGAGEFASVPRRSAVAEAQAAGEVLWEMKKTAAREAWQMIEPGLRHIANIVCPPPQPLNMTESHGPQA